MKFIRVGQTSDGRSTVEDVKQQEWAAPAGELRSVELWVAEMIATGFGYCDRRPDLRPQRCPPGAGSWKLVRFAEGATAPMHRTDTLDCDTLIAGSLELILQVGSVDLEPGDTVLIPGSAHSWRAGSHGCTMSAMLYGLEP